MGSGTLTKKTLCTFLLYCYIFYVFIAHWIWFGRGIQEDLMIIISAIILLNQSSINSTQRQLRIGSAAIMIFLICCCIWGIIEAESVPFLKDDIKSIVGPVIVGLGIIESVKVCCSKNSDLLSKAQRYLNVFFMFNNFLIIVQYFVPFFMMNKKAIVSTGNPVYFDQLTGLFGVNGTTRWNLWAIFILILNFNASFKTRNNKLLIYNILFFFMNCIIAMINSARAYFVLAPLAIMICLFIMEKKKIIKISNWFWIFAICIIVAFFLYTYNDYINKFVNDIITDKLKIYMTMDINTMVKMNDDRARAVAYAIEIGGLWGVGIGVVPMHSTSTTVKYIGLNSASSYILLIGRIGYILITILFAQLGMKNDKKVYISKFVAFFIFTFIAGYCIPVYSGFALLPVLFLMFFIYSDENMETIPNNE